VPADATALRLIDHFYPVPRVTEAATLGFETEPLCGKGGSSAKSNEAFLDQPVLHFKLEWILKVTTCRENYQRLLLEMNLIKDKKPRPVATVC
jgi:hypothetical protein